MSKQPNGEYYSVKIIRQIVVEGEPEPTLLDENYNDNEQTFEECLILIQAQSYGHALGIAKKHLEETQDSYKNMYGQTVTWKFIQIVDCFEITDELVSGAELYSCLHTTNKDELAEDFIKKWFDSSDTQ